MPFSVSSLLVCVTQIESDTSRLWPLDWLPFAPQCCSAHIFARKDCAAQASTTCKFPYFFFFFGGKKEKHLKMSTTFRDLSLH